MKALIAAGLGVMALGGILVANSGRSASATPATFASQSSRTTLVNCGEGRQAMIWADPNGSGAQRVECVPQQPAFGYVGGMPVSQQLAGATAFTAPGVMPQVVPPVVQERVVYRDRVSAPVRTSSARRARTANPTYSPARSGAYEPVSQTRSWKKSAIIIGGSTAAGAGVGAVLDGKSGAKKGAVVGLVGGTIYDIATRTKK
jgi:hypothetical protein